VRKEHSLNKLEVLMLYSALPHEYQHKVFERGADRSIRRIILATNIAETSVTIPGVRFVVDCGHMKVRSYDNQRLLDMLTIIPVSRANAKQRAGRAGREGPGKCFQLYPKNAFDEL
jgi:HrpA-like RNA helicase